MHQPVALPFGRRRLFISSMPAVKLVYAFVQAVGKNNSEKGMGKRYASPLHIQEILLLRNEKALKHRLDAFTCFSTDFVYIFILWWYHDNLVTNTWHGE